MMKRSIMLVVSMLAMLFPSYAYASSDTAQESGGPPRVKVAEPANYSTIDSDVLHTHVAADSGSAASHIYVELVSQDNQTIETAEGDGELKRDFNVSAYRGQTLYLNIDVMNDSSKQDLMLYRTLYVEANPLLSKIAQVNGSIHDFDGSRILYVGEDGVLRIKNLRTGTDEAVYGDQRILEARLVPGGAVLTAGPFKDGYEHLLLWKKGAGALDTGLRHDETCCHEDARLQVAGSYVIRATAHAVDWLDTQTGRSYSYKHDELTEYAADLQRDGSFIFSGLSDQEGVTDIYRSRPEGGIALAVPHEEAGSHHNPVGDANTIVYANGAGEILRQSGGKTTVLSSAGAAATYLYPHRDYEVACGWTAYTKEVSKEGREIFVQSPEGTVTQVTYMAASRPQIDKLAPDGTFTFRADHLLYMHVPGSGELLNLGSDAGGTYRIDHIWYKTIGNALYRIQSK